MKASVVHPPTRGTIIVDTVSLVRMCPTLPGAFLTKEAQGRPVCVADALAFLANHGYEVIVPEMVAYEAGRFLRDGTAPSTYNPRTDHTQVSRFHALTEKILSRIPGLHATGSNIRIEPPVASDTSEGARMLRNLWRTHTASDTYVRNGRIKYMTLDKYHQFSSIDETHRFGEDWGDIAAHALIKAMKPTDTPVFYLTDDADAAKAACALRTDIPLNHLTFTGLYAGLYNQKLLPALGIKAEYPSEAIRLYTTDALRKMGVRTQAIPPAHDVTATEKEAESYPFRSSLKGLKEELEAGQATGTVTAPAVTSQVDKFKKRYENRTANAARIP